MEDELKETALCGLCGEELEISGDYIQHHSPDICAENLGLRLNAAKLENARLRAALSIAGNYLKSMDFEDEKFAREALKGGE